MLAVHAVPLHAVPMPCTFACACAWHAGNVWEWTATHFSKSSGQRVLRGGSYLDSAAGEFNHRVTVATRMGNTEDSAADNMGFRCAQSSSAGPKGVKPQGYAYDQSKRKRPPPGVGDPLKSMGEGAAQARRAAAILRIPACNHIRTPPATRYASRPPRL